jgi:hypothetical protein
MLKVTALFALAIVTASAQTEKPNENPYTELTGDGLGKTTKTKNAKPAPRAPDGKPDLSGFWQGPLIFGGMFKSVGGPPLTSAGEEAFKFKWLSS